VGRSAPLAGTALLGRVSEATLHLDHEGVSRRHARLHQLDDGRYEIEDLKSRNGTFVNGERIKRQGLVPGDLIQLGSQVVLLFTLHDSLEERLADQQRMSAVNSLAAAVAHDMNNLLSVIQMSMEHLQSLSELQHVEDAVECVEDAAEATQLAAGLAQRLLSLARPASQDGRVIEIRGIAERVEQLMRRALPPHITMKVSVEPGLYVMSDADQMQQVLTNLCVNARDAMPDGGTITIHGQRVQSRGGPNEAAGSQWVELTVQDTGMGMSEDVQKRIFEPFFTTKKGEHGSGLGLAVVRSIVRDRGGDVSVDSAIGRGSGFRLRFPAVARPGLVTNPGELAIGANPTPRRIMLVNADKLVLRSATRLLEGRGHTVIGALGMGEALTRYGAAHKNVDFVLLDVDLNQDSGKDFVRAIRAIDPRAKVIVATGHPEILAKEHFGDVHVNAFVGKPLHAQSLEQVFQAHAGPQTR
jgi:signal transduction histidine kinase/ActR/RegA family two-component response regulator